MKRLLVAGVLLVGVSAHAQYSPSASVDGSIEQAMHAGEVCKRNSEGYVVCQYIGSSVAEEPPAPTLAQGVRTWGGIDPQFPANMPPDQKYCLKKKEHVLAKFALGAAVGNANALAETYYWNGFTDETSLPIVERLQSVAVSGHWERSYVEQWDGPEKAIARVPIYVRWVTDDSTLPILHFTLRQDAEFGCWFLQGVSPPSETVQIHGVYRQGRVLRTDDNSGEWEEAPRTEVSDEPNEGGFVLVR